MSAVAKKSPVGENDVQVTTLAVRKASIRRPEGMSNFLIIESSDIVISHMLTVNVNGAILVYLGQNYIRLMKKTQRKVDRWSKTQS
jgi:hypothetical protein